MGYSVEFLDPSQIRKLKPGKKVEVVLDRLGSAEIMTVR
jgi:hypothetical protein